MSFFIDVIEFQFNGIINKLLLMNFSLSKWTLDLCYWYLKRTIEDTIHSDERRLFFNEGQKV